MARVDAARNRERILEVATRALTAADGSTPVSLEAIARDAGVGIGTLYRHFPQRSDLVIAVLEREIDACAAAGPALAAEHEPGVALARWLDRLVEFVGTKRGFATALHSGDPAYDGLPGYLMEKLAPALGTLLDTATAAGDIRAEVSPRDLLYAVAKLCAPLPDEAPDYGRRMVTLLVAGLRAGA